MSVIAITNANFEQEVLKSDKPVLVDFWASWCGPCKMLLPIIEEVSAEQTAVKICKINVDEQMELARQFRVMSIPTLIMFENGEIKKKTMGYMPKEELLEFMK